MAGSKVPTYIIINIFFFLLKNIVTKSFKNNPLKKQ